MLAVRYFAYPHAGAWAVAHWVPGTRVVSIDMLCRTFEVATAEARRLTTTGGRA
jgi:hypothetical protein